MQESSKQQKEIWSKTWQILGKHRNFPEIEPYFIDWHRKLIQTLEREIAFLKLKDILECGCGNGIFGLEIANKYPHFSLTLSDISPHALEYSRVLLKACRERRHSEHFARILPLYVLEDMFFLSHSDNSFDVVINGGTLEHYKDEEIRSLVGEMIRVTRPGKFAVIVVPNIRNFDLARKRLRLKIQALSGNRFFRNIPPYGGNDERDITPRKFRRIIENLPMIQSTSYFSHPVSYPSFVSRALPAPIYILEPLFAYIGFHWANIYILHKESV